MKAGTEAYLEGGPKDGELAVVLGDFANWEKLEFAEPIREPGCIIRQGKVSTYHKTDRVDDVGRPIFSWVADGRL